MCAIGRNLEYRTRWAEHASLAGNQKNGKRDNVPNTNADATMCGIPEGPIKWRLRWMPEDSVPSARRLGNRIPCFLKFGQQDPL